MRILITLCARGGSIGIPGKNIRPLAGQPLIAYSIQLAKAVARNYPDVQIELSTDDPLIRQVASEWGLSTDYTRPAELATAQSGKVDTIRHVLVFAEKKYNTSFDYILDLDVSAPLRTLEDIRNAFVSMEKKPEALTLFTVNEARKNPYFNMVEENEQGYYLLSKGKEQPYLTRQAAPAVYELNASFYIYRRAFFSEARKGVITERSIIYKMPSLCFDLDTPLDFEWMDYLIRKGHLTLYQE